MSEWIPVENAALTEGLEAVVLTDFGPQLCVWDDTEKFWVQMLRGGYYGLGLDGVPTHYLPLPSLPSAGPR
jgi:hypothetical protein